MRDLDWRVFLLLPIVFFAVGAAYSTLKGGLGLDGFEAILISLGLKGFSGVSTGIVTIFRDTIIVAWANLLLLLLGVEYSKLSFGEGLLPRVIKKLGVSCALAPMMFTVALLSFYYGAILGFVWTESGLLLALAAMIPYGMFQLPILFTVAGWSILNLANDVHPGREVIMRVGIASIPLLALSSIIQVKVAPQVLSLLISRGYLG